MVLACCVVLIAIATWGLFEVLRQNERAGTTSNAVAMLDGVVDAQWSNSGDVVLQPGSPIEPGMLRLESGLAQIVFYSGARVAIEGPADLRIISAREASCPIGRLIAEVPVQAQGFRIATPQTDVTDLGTVFGLNVTASETEIHVFEGRIQHQSHGAESPEELFEGDAAVVRLSNPTRYVAANTSGFASLFGLSARSSAASEQRYVEWRSANSLLSEDPSLLLHYDFDHASATEWRLHNTSLRGRDFPSATIVGCRWTDGRWANKSALQFQSVNDRVRLSVPGEMDAISLTAWVRVQGLDRKFNSLFMCDGHRSGTIHWLIRNDGVLGLSVFGWGAGEFQISASPPEITLDKIGMWLHLAVVLDADARRITHYVNGRAVSDDPLRIDTPFRIETAELGNWNADGYVGPDSDLIRNFSGAMDEFSLFDRALSANEILERYNQGKPQPGRLSTR